MRILRWIALLGLVSLTFATAMTPTKAHASETPVAAKFDKKSYTLRSGDAAKIVNLAEKGLANPKLVFTISEASLGRKPTSFDYLTARARSLRIFQTMVRKGIDPARISFAPSTWREDHTVKVTAKEQNSTPSTPALTPADASAKKAKGEFVINFKAATVIPVNLHKPRLQELLATVSQPELDTIWIEGFTDIRGSAAYNRALGEARSLVIFEMLVRSGVAAQRIETQNHGASVARPIGADGGHHDRRVVIRWNEQKVSSPQPETPEAPTLLAAADVPPAKAEDGFRFDVVPFAGALLPAGKLSKHANPGLIYGLGLGMPLWTTAANEARITLYASANSSLKAKESDRNGPLDVRLINLRGDFVFTQGVVRPFVGLGLGGTWWKGNIKQPSTALRNKNSSQDVGGLVAVGLDIQLISQLFLEPEISYHQIGGNTAISYTTGVLALRWRI